MLILVVKFIALFLTAPFRRASTGRPAMCSIRNSVGKHSGESRAEVSLQSVCSYDEGIEGIAPTIRNLPRFVVMNDPQYTCRQVVWSDADGSEKVYGSRQSVG